MRTPRAGSSWTRSRGCATSWAGSTSCTPTTRATRRGPAPTPTPTSARARSGSTRSARWSGPPARRSWSRRRGTRRRCRAGHRVRPGSARRRA
jgi:hypothetical protein